MANKNISVVNVTTANEPVFSSSVEIQHLSACNCYNLKNNAGNFGCYPSYRLEDAFLSMLFHECVPSFELSECHVKEDVFHVKELRILTVLCFLFKMAYFLYLQMEMMTEIFSVS